MGDVSLIVIHEFIVEDFKYVGDTSKCKDGFKLAPPPPPPFLLFFVESEVDMLDFISSTSGSFSTWSSHSCVQDAFSKV